MKVSVTVEEMHQAYFQEKKRICTAGSSRKGPRYAGSSSARIIILSSAELISRNNRQHSQATKDLALLTRICGEVKEFMAG